MLARELKRAAELPAEDLMRRQAGDVLVVQEDAPGIRLKEAGDNIEQGRLASAVGADQAGDRAFPHLDRAVVDGAQATEILYQTLHRSEEHQSELQSLMRISYAVFCLKKKKKPTTTYALA